MNRKTKSLKLIVIFLIILITTSLIYADSTTRKYRKKSNTNSKVEEKKEEEKDQKIHHLQPIKKGEQIPKHLIERKTYKDSRKKVHLKKKDYQTYHHTPSNKIRVHKKHYRQPVYYHYTTPPRYIYKGLWIRIRSGYDNGFYYYQGYPYYVYNHYLHRYSYDPGSYDLVDGYTYETYATFYGNSLRQSYDRCAELRDILNNREGDYRYFCAERFIYDTDYKYGWNPANYPNWLWR